MFTRSALVARNALVARRALVAFKALVARSALVARAPETFLPEETEWTSFKPLFAGMVVVDLLFAIVFFVMAMVVSLVSVKFDFCLHTALLQPACQTL